MLRLLLDRAPSVDGEAMVHFNIRNSNISLPRNVMSVQYLLKDKYALFLRNTKEEFILFFLDRGARVDARDSVSKACITL